MLQGVERAPSSPTAPQHTSTQAKQIPPLSPDSSRLRGAVREWVLVTVGYALVACIATWPMALRMTRGVYGFGNDQFGGVWNSWWLHKAWWDNLPISPTAYLQSPYGLPFDERFIQPLDRFLAITLGGPGNGLFANNIETFSSFIIAGVTMYAFARYLTGNRLAAAFAGLVFTTSPFHLAISLQYASMAAIQWWPLFGLALVVAFRRKRLRDGAYVGAVLALMWISSYYYGWFAFVIAATCSIIVLVRGFARAARQRRAGPFLLTSLRLGVSRGAVTVAVFAAIALPLLLPLARRVASDQSTYARSLSDAYQASVRPWQYFLPPHDNPIFGRLTSGFVNANTGILPNYEQATYLGIVPVALGVVGLVFWRRLGSRARFALPVLIGSAVVAALMTLGPYLPLNIFSLDAWRDPLGGAHIKNLPYFLYELAPQFRYYGRAFVWVSCVVAAASAIGLAVLITAIRQGPGWKRAAAAVGLPVLAAVLTFAEFTNAPPSRWMDLPLEQWMIKVRDLPRSAAIVDYPIKWEYDPRTYWYIYAATQHEHAIAAPARTVEGKSLATQVADPNDPFTGRRLSEAGLGYVVMHTRMPPSTRPPYQPALGNDAMSADAGAQNPWFRLHAVTDDAIIYRVLRAPRSTAAEPSSVSITTAGGFHPPEPVDNGAGAWQGGDNTSRIDDLDQATLSVRATGTPQRVAISFNATSFQRSRVLRVSLGTRVLARARVPAGETIRVTFPLVVVAGWTDLAVHVSPGAETASAVAPTDLRSLGVRLSDTQAVPAPAAASLGPTFGKVRFDGSALIQQMAGRSGLVRVAAPGPGIDGSLALRLRSPMADQVVAVGDRRQLLLRRGAWTDIQLPIRTSGPSAQTTVRTSGRSVVDAQAPTVLPSGFSPLTFTFSKAFYPPEPMEGQAIRWMRSQTGSIAISSRIRQQVRVTVPVQSFHRTRTVILSLNGQRMVRTLIPADSTRSLSLSTTLAPGRHRLTVDATPGPESVSAAAGSPDSRSVSIAVGEPRSAPPARPETSGAPMSGTAFGYGFHATQSRDIPGWRWLSGRSGELAVDGTGQARSGILTFRVASPDGPRKVAIVIGRKAIVSRTVGRTPTLFRVPVMVGDQGTKMVRVATSGQLKELPPSPMSPDGRLVTLRVSQPSLALGGAPYR